MSERVYGWAVCGIAGFVEVVENGGVDCAHCNREHDKGRARGLYDAARIGSGKKIHAVMIEEPTDG